MRHSPEIEGGNLHDQGKISHLLQERSLNKTIILAGFNYGYKDMLLNMLCRFEQLNVSNYVIPAFDLKAMSHCIQHDLPCFYAGVDKSDTAQQESKAILANTSDVQLYGSKGFEGITKQKSRQTLLVLQLGYDVLWTDVDIFWKQDPRRDVLTEMENDVNIGIQTDALPTQCANVNINSGFYYVRQSEATVQVFEEIVKDGSTSSSSEQVSFNNVLCTSKVGTEDCVYEKHMVKTHTLNRFHYPNGSMEKKMKNGTKLVDFSSDDDIMIVHFNYRRGRETKQKSFQRAGMWLLQGPHSKCIV